MVFNQNHYSNNSAKEEIQESSRSLDRKNSLFQPITVDKVTIGELLSGIKRRWKTATLVGLAVGITYVAYYYLFLRSYQRTISLQVEAIKPLGGRPGTSSESIRSLVQSLPSVPMLSGETRGDTTTLIQILNSDLVLKPLYEKFLESYPELDSETYTYESFRRSIKIEPQQLGFGNIRLGNTDSKVIQITFSSDNKHKLNSALNLFAEKIIEFNEKEKQQQIFQNLRYVNQEIQRTLSQIDDLEDQLNQFRSANQVLRPDSIGSMSASGSSDADLYRMQLANLITARNENNAKIESVQQTFDSINSQLQMTPAEALVASNLSTSVNYTNLLTNLTDVEKRLAEELSRLQPNAPTVRSLDEERRLILAQIKQEAQQIAQRNQVSNPESLIGYQSSVSEGLIGKYIDAKVELESLRRMDEELDRQIAATRQELVRLTLLANPYRKIEQRIAAAQQSLQLLLQTRQSLQLQIAQQDFTWRILSDLEDTEQYKVTMRLSNALVIALILGIASGVVLALILDLLDSRFLEVEQVRQNTGLPIVGQIPLASEFDQYSFTRLETPLTLWGLQHYLAGGTPTFRESFYFLLSHLEQLGLQRTLAVTSAQAGEGRTTIAAYLALAAATLGKRVLLIDVNLRQPGLHQVFGIANTSGLAELLTGTLPLPNWFSLFEAHSEKLWVLTAGQPQQEPMSLLSSPQWHSFLASTQAAFDLVIIDTAPMVQCAETNRLVASVDQALFVVRLGKTKRDAFAKALKEYDLGLKDKAIGIVVNGVGAPQQSQVEGLPIPSSSEPQSAAVS
ncbi:AAA family ATPase [Thermosynechococcus sichuanensis E542]|uniref:non-specific protein-tyrosine kinase n=1 Tax=Thermosynechococcus sichuanensis E542 TaxID=2016101 RepID=A0A3B7MG86_9CYAN|nr:polysaccharide biosynthesis tyrosine autokinase [Thermosynechococcus vestitus]AXY68628.1 AAA family ATPase [Thermosynechococcus vestitus E542]